MQLGSGFHILSPGISHPPKRIPSQRRNQKLLVSVIAITERIMQTAIDIQVTDRKIPARRVPGCILNRFLLLLMLKASRIDLPSIKDNLISDLCAVDYILKV